MRLSSRLFWAAALVGAVLRILVARSVGGRLDSDQAVVYLMARHGGGGRLFWGQSYGGTVLQQTAADAFRVFGPSVPVLQVVEALWWFAAVLLLRALGARLWGRFAGDLAGALLWLPGPALLWLTIRDPGFYGPTVALGTGALLLALDDRRLSPVRGAVLGFVAGLAAWTSPMGLAFVVPAVAFALLRRSARRASVMAVLVGAALGALPLLLASLSPGGPTAASPRTSVVDVPTRAAQVVFRLLPSAWVTDSLWERAVIGLLWTGLVLGGTVLALSRRAWKQVTVAAVGVLAAVVLAGSTAILLPVSLRYGAVLAPVPFLLLAAGFATLGRAKWLGWVLVLALAGWALQVSDQVTGGFRSANGNHWEGEGGDLRRDGRGYARARSIDVPRLVEYLQSQGIRAVYADYWVSYLIAAQSGERVTADPLSQSRYPLYRTRAAAAPWTTVVVFSGSENEKRIRESAGLPSYTATEIVGLTVFVFRAQVPLALLPQGTY
ncbi:MAG: hypothetical protein JWM02_3259 [Frankiales bacterium]|nr:hypothetical protein [Frankiales bacterium]